MAYRDDIYIVARPNPAIEAIKRYENESKSILNTVTDPHKTSIYLPPIAFPDDDDRSIARGAIGEIARGGQISEEGLVTLVVLGTPVGTSAFIKQSISTGTHDS